MAAKKADRKAASRAGPRAISWQQSPRRCEPQTSQYPTSAFSASRTGLASRVRLAVFFETRRIIPCRRVSFDWQSPARLPAFPVGNGLD